MTLTSRWASYMQLFQLQRLQIQRLQILLFTLSCQNMDLIGPGTGRPHDKPHLITVMQHYQSTQQQCFTMCLLLVTHMATYKHTCIHLYIYLLTSLYLSCFANSYQCWQAIIDKDQAELQAKGLHLPKVIALPHATNIDQWIQSTRLGHLMNARLKRIREYEETSRASIPYDSNPRKLQDGITRKRQKLEHFDSVINLDITPGYFSRVVRQMRNLKLCIAKDYHRFRLCGAPHAPEDLEPGCLVLADI